MQLRKRRAPRSTFSHCKERTEDREEAVNVRDEQLCHTSSAWDMASGSGSKAVTKQSAAERMARLEVPVLKVQSKYFPPS